MLRSNRSGGGGLFLENGQTKEDSFLWGLGAGSFYILMEFVLDRGICVFVHASRIKFENHRMNISSETDLKTKNRTIVFVSCI